MNAFLRLFAALLVVVAAAPALGQEVTVRVDVRPTETFLGEPVNLLVVVDGADRVEGPAPPAFAPDFHASAPEYRNRSSTSTTIINGVQETRQTVGCVLIYALRPLRAGVLTIPALEVRTGGKSVSTEPLKLRVIGPSSSGVAELELRLSSDRVLVEEPVTFELLVRLRALELEGEAFDADPWFPREPLEMRIPWFQDLEGFFGGDFVAWARPLVQSSGFSVNAITSQDFFNDRVVQFAFPAETVERDGVRWREYRLRRDFRPLAAGTLEIPTSTLRGNVVTRVALRGRRSSPVATDSEAVFLDHAPVTLVVEDVPTVGRPPTYRHAIGRYKAETEVEPRRAKVGDPMKLTLRVWGEGLADRVLAPVLSKQANLAEHFAVSEPASAPEIDGTTKVFTYTIRPRNAEVDAVPPIEFAFYDLATRGFDVALSKEAPIEVEAASEVGAGDLVGGVGGLDRSSSPGEELTGGLLANEGFAEMLADESYAPASSPVFWLLLLGAPIAYGGVAGAAIRRRRRLADPLRLRAARALDDAQPKLDEARTRLAEGDSAGAAEALHHALVGFVAARARRPSGGMTAADVRALFEERGVTASALIGAMEMCERVRFGGASAAELEAALGQADGWLAVLRKEALA